MRIYKRFAAKSLIAASTAFAVFLALLALWRASGLVLVVFAGILLALFLRGIADWVSARSRLSAGWSLAAVVIAICAVLVGLGFWIVPKFADQLDELLASLPQSVGALRAQIEHYAWGRKLLQQDVVSQAVVPPAADLLSTFTGAFSTTLTAFGHAVIVAAIGLFIAIEPKIYLRVVVRLVPVDFRARAQGVLEEIGHVLMRWLMARLTAMAFVGVLTAAGLWFLNVPLALTLAILTMALGFIPNLGPIIAALPAVLIGLLQSPGKAVYVALLFILIQTIEGYLITPLLQRRAIAMPPALLISAQVALGLFFGLMGLLLATPLTAAVLVLIRRFYLEDILHDTADEPYPPGAEAASSGASAPADGTKPAAK